MVILVALINKVALITGSSGGIGFAISKEFAENQGATVLLCSRDINNAIRISRRINGNTQPIELDVTNEKEVKSVVRGVISDHGGIDILVNSAGHRFENSIWYKKYHQMTDRSLDAILEVDLKGTIHMTRAFLPSMVRKTTRFSGTSGVIINVSSTPALSGQREGAPYTIAKAAVIAVTKHIALEYGKKRIRAYTLALGNIATDATFYSMTKGGRKQATSEPAMERWGTAEEVAKVAACLGSESFSYATGNTIIIDGGKVLV
ncbi:MAG TPA: SDR family NAD(P)-dependent oxidoreductase [Nitrososphaeraceae archaeon]|nr:SDR family NAD(P)-dependent oxidoreductase [Nitrososphaeraceae archaeon]